MYLKPARAQYTKETKSGEPQSFEATQAFPSSARALL